MECITKVDRLRKEPRDCMEVKKALISGDIHHWEALSILTECYHWDTLMASKFLEGWRLDAKNNI